MIKRDPITGRFVSKGNKRIPITGRFVSKGNKMTEINRMTGMAAGARPAINPAFAYTFETLKESKKSTVHAFGHKAVVYKPYAQLQDYPMCCGASMITGMGYDNKIFKKDLPYLVDRAATLKKGMVVVIINHNQVAGGFDKILEQHGFIIANDGVTNPVHSDATSIYLYTKLIGKETVDKDNKRTINKGL